MDRVSGDIARSLAWKDPVALEYLAQRSIDWRHAREPYDAAIRAVKQKTAGKRYVATESVFDLLAADVGLTNVTPAGYRNASANESEPSPGDVNDVQKLLRDEQVDVLVFNAQTSGAIPEQLRRAAEDGGVPVVDVTESIPPGQPGFIAWQVDQLERLAKALG